MAMTLRLPDGLESDAKSYAAKLGISVNALAAVALREYIDDRAMRRSVQPSEIPDKGSGKVGITQAEKPSAEYRRPKNRDAPCPCGATKPNGRPIPWRHCHGKAP